MLVCNFDIGTVVVFTIVGATAAKATIAMVSFWKMYCPLPFYFPSSDDIIRSVAGDTAEMAGEKGGKRGSNKN